MKRFVVSTVLAVFLINMAVGLFGCSFAQPGETVAEGHRRHIRNWRLNQQQLMDDVDSVLMLEKHSVLNEKTIP